jgi:transposase
MPEPTPTWEHTLRDAHHAITHAKDQRAATFKAATAHGYTRQQIAQATGLSPAAIQRIVGKTRRPNRNLNEPAQ